MTDPRWDDAPREPGPGAHAGDRWPIADRRGNPGAGWRAPLPAHRPPLAHGDAPPGAWHGSPDGRPGPGGAEEPPDAYRAARHPGPEAFRREAQPGGDPFRAGGYRGEHEQRAAAGAAPQAPAQWSAYGSPGGFGAQRTLPPDTGPLWQPEPPQQRSPGDVRDERLRSDSGSGWGAYGGQGPGGAGAGHGESGASLQTGRWPRSPEPFRENIGSGATGGQPMGAGSFGGPAAHAAADAMGHAAEQGPGAWLGQQVGGGYAGGLGHQPYEGQGSMAGSGWRARRLPKGYVRSDERIRDEVWERLVRCRHVDAGDVLVEVNRGEVTLTGDVPERRMKHAIEDVVDDILGVREIHNQIRVRRPGEAGGDGRGEAAMSSGQSGRGQSGRGSHQPEGGGTPLAGGGGLPGSGSGPAPSASMQPPEPPRSSGSSGTSGSSPQATPGHGTPDAGGIAGRPVPDAAHPGAIGNAGGTGIGGSAVGNDGGGATVIDKRTPPPLPGDVPPGPAGGR